ncbi:phosphatase PAP2 family protein [Sulfurovum sp.]|uniref:phosphatase PAP2 family protein n=1 Tax=Sulfurovum sp. TaxID=1969726 RepID=UPI0025DBA3DF|nr:phosphatase PAP2 family protein [Sulfurovum sp.]
MGTKLIALLKKHPFLIVANLFGLYLFSKMAEDVIEKEFILVIDRWISIHVNALQTPVLNSWMIALTHMNGGMGILVFSAVVMVILVYLKWYRDLWFYLVTVIGSATAFMIIKSIVGRLRPGSEVIEVSGYAFPSGHATMASAMSAALYFILVKRVDSVILKTVLLLACITWPLMIAASRVYLDVHWLSDVIAGLGLGLFWTTLVALFFEWRDNGRS